MAGRDIFQALQDLPFRRFALAKIAQATRLARKLGMPALGFDQYPGKAEPAAFSCWYGPIGLQATRHVTDGTGFNALAPLVTPDTFILPLDTNPLTGHDYAFRWQASNVAAYIQWSNTSGSGPHIAGALGGLFDPAIGDNGGGIVLQNFSQSPTANTPRLCFEIDLYDRKRGRSMTDNRIPAEALIGGAYEDKRSFGGMTWEADTEIEPRVYITEFFAPLATDDLYNAANVAAWLNIGFFGEFTFDRFPSGAQS